MIDRSFQKPSFLIAIGDNATRKRISKLVAHPIGQVIHPSAQIDRLTHIALGVQIMPGTVVNRGTTIGSTASSIQTQLLNTIVN